MRKSFSILLLSLVSLMMLFPGKIKADNKFDAGECIKKYGEISFDSVGSYTSSMGRSSVRYTNGLNNNVYEGNKEWTEDPVSFTVELKSPSSNYKVKDIDYEIIVENGKTECEGKITGSDIENNTGSVKLKAVINNGTVTSISFGGVSVNWKNPKDTLDITSGRIFIMKKASQKDATRDDTKIKTEEATKFNISEEDAEKIVGKRNLCEEGSSLRNFFHTVWKVIVMFAPPLLILMSSVEFFKAITASDADRLNKATSSVLKRTLALVLLLLLRFILNIIFGWVGLDLCL